MKNRLTAGIITYHEPYSYGAHLQCLGLQMFLQKLGYETEIIDYSMEAYQELRVKKKVRSFIYRGIRFLSHPRIFLRAKKNTAENVRKSYPFQKQLGVRNKKFKEFQGKYYRLSPKRYENHFELKRDCPRYSAYICGSDQIWNPNFCDMDDNYFLAFAPEGKRIAYAPSFGVRGKGISRFLKKEYRKRLSAIDFLSVREKTGAEIVKEFTGKDIPIVIDPTFLIDAGEWLKIADDSEIDLPSEYILTYFIGIDEYSQAFLQDVKQAFPDYEIINLIFDQSEYGPCDFIKLISRAKFVFTNSFHGLAFCINLNVPFAVGKTLKDYGVSNGFSRIDDLLESLKLDSRFYDGKVKLDDSWFYLDFAETNRRKEQWIQSSENYLKNALAEVVKDHNM